MDSGHHLSLLHRHTEDEAPYTLLLRRCHNRRLPHCIPHDLPSFHHTLCSRLLLLRPRQQGRRLGPLPHTHEDYPINCKLPTPRSKRMLCDPFRRVDQFHLISLRCTPCLLLNYRTLDRRLFAMRQAHRGFLQRSTQTGQPFLRSTTTANRRRYHHWRISIRKRHPSKLLPLQLSSLQSPSPSRHPLAWLQHHGTPETRRFCQPLTQSPIPPPLDPFPSGHQPRTLQGSHHSSL